MIIIFVKDRFKPSIDFRDDAAAIIRQMEALARETPGVSFDLTDVVVSRSAADEFYKEVVADSAPLHDVLSFVNPSEDFSQKMKAVRRTQHLKKIRRTFSPEQMLSLGKSDELYRLVRSLR